MLYVMRELRLLAISATHWKVQSRHSPGDQLRTSGWIARVGVPSWR